MKKLFCLMLATALLLSVFANVAFASHSMYYKTYSFNDAPFYPYKGVIDEVFYYNPFKPRELQSYMHTEAHTFFSGYFNELGTRTRVMPPSSSTYDNPAWATKYNLSNQGTAQPRNFDKPVSGTWRIMGEHRAWWNNRANYKFRHANAYKNT